MMTHHNFLTIDDVIVAVADRFGLAIRDIAAAMRFGQHLPDTDFGAGNRRQEFTFLLLGAPADQNRRDNTCQGIEYMGQVEPILEELGFQHHLVIHRKPRSAVFFGINGKKPAFCPEFFGETAAELILVFVFASGPGGGPAQVLVTTHLFRQPGADFLSKLDYIWRFCGNIKIHTNLLSKRFPTNSYHPAGSELLNSVTVVPQPRQDFFSVFSEQRCRAEKLRRRAGEIDWAPDQIT